MSEQDRNSPEKKDDLDMETTFADMNIDGFKWYDPSKKSGAKGEKIKLTRKEKRAITKAAFQAMLPIFGVVCALFVVLYLLMMLWLA